MQDLKARTKQFALDCIRFVSTFRQSPESSVIGRQLVRASCSVGANYRATQRSRTKAEFVSKLGIVEEEADESAYWIELSIACDLGNERIGNTLLAEAYEITAIVVASRKTAKMSSYRG